MSISRWSRMAGSFNAQDRRSLFGMGAFIVLLHVIGFGVLILFVIPARYDLGTTSQRAGS